MASQFKADPKPREAVHRDVPPVSDTFSPRFRRLQAAASSAVSAKKVDGKFKPGEGEQCD